MAGVSSVQILYPQDYFVFGKGQNGSRMLHTPLLVAMALKAQGIRTVNTGNGRPAPLYVRAVGDTLDPELPKLIRSGVTLVLDQGIDAHPDGDLVTKLWGQDFTGEWAFDFEGREPERLDFLSRARSSVPGLGVRAFTGTTKGSELLIV